MALSQRRRRIVGRLRHRRSREREGLVLVEGVRAAAEALEAGAEVRFAVASPRLDTLGGGAAIRLALGSRGVDLEDVDDIEVVELSDTEHPQGLMLVCAEPKPGANIVRGGGRYLVLDAVQDPGNVGTLIRAATAFALDAVLVLSGSADPWGAKAVRSSAGMVFRVPVLSLDAAGCLGLLREAHVPVLVGDAGGQDVTSATEGQGWALAVANEGSGPRSEVRAGASALVRIPMPGPAESLNAGVAGAILLYALTRGDEHAPS